ADELDGTDRAERHPVDGEIEANIHQREHASQQQHAPSGGQVEAAVVAPGTAPSREHYRGACDPQPRYTEWRNAREQENREGRAQVVEDRADQEEGEWRNALA